MDEPFRVGDEERWAVDARLQSAVGEGRLSLAEYEQRSGEVWQARTRGELDLVVRDLPVPAPAPAPSQGGPPRTRRVLAVMSGDALRGPVATGQGVEAYAVMGGAEIDLRSEDLPAEVRVRAVAVMGGVEVLVPRGVTVHLTGVSLMGGRDVHTDPPVPGGPVVHVEAYALMGGVEVKHGKQAPEAKVRPGSALAPAATALAAAPPTRSGSLAVPGGRRPRVRAGRIAAAAALVAVLGGTGYAATSRDAFAVFGSTTAEVLPGDTRVEVGMLFGSVKVVVPNDAVVTMDGRVIFGSAENKVRGGAGEPIEIDGVGAFGSIEVVTEAQASDESAD